MRRRISRSSASAAQATANDKKAAAEAAHGAVDGIIAQMEAKLDELKGQVRLNGFRPGKVPVAHLKRLYGRAVMAEMIEAARQRMRPAISSAGSS